VFISPRKRRRENLIEGKRRGKKATVSRREGKEGKKSLRDKEMKKKKEDKDSESFLELGYVWKKSGFLFPPFRKEWGEGKNSRSLGEGEKGRPLSSLPMDSREAFSRLSRWGWGKKGRDKTEPGHSEGSKE